MASFIHDESKKPLVIMRTIPIEGWCESVERFFMEIQQNCIAMSGKRFFFMTRSIIVSLAGVIVTYVLVLLQFDADKITSEMFNPCPELNLH